MSDATKPANVAETLKAARALIEDPEHWIKHDFARPSKRSRRDVDAKSPEATCWCAVGALKAVDGQYEWPAIETLVRVVRPSARPWETSNVYYFNDSHTHADVLAMFDKAIALAESQP